jgi:hypothetical protein
MQQALSFVLPFGVNVIWFSVPRFVGMHFGLPVAPVHTTLSGHMIRVDAARSGASGVQVMTMAQLASRLAGGFLQPIDAEELLEAVRAALAGASLGELDVINGDKAWNAYAVLISAAEANYSESVVLSAIEENLVGVRKIARAGVRDVADVRDALLPLLPLQSAPKLEAVDMDAEIRLRTTELPSRAVDAFLSGAEEAVVIQVLEEGQ